MRFRLPVDQFVSSLSGLPIQFHDKASSDEFCQRPRQFLVFVANSRCASQREHTSRLLVIAGSSINDDHSFPKRMFLLLSDDPLEEFAECSARNGYGQRLEPQGERGLLQVKTYQGSSSSVRTETVFGPPDLLALNHHVANGATDSKDCDGDGNGNTGSRVHGYSNHRRNALVLRKW